jgi:hypothetical protein
MIESKSDEMCCPSILSNCNNEITGEDIKAVIGEDNYYIFMINKLQLKLNSLEMKDEKTV